MFVPKHPHDRKIGDSRLGSMETGLGLTRALEAVRRNKCDLINLSYGEPTVSDNRDMVNRSAVLRAFRRVVDEESVLFVTSAGNAGPALTTVGAPAAPISDSVIGVGAYVEPKMMNAQYSLLKKLPQTMFTWSSRGPTRNGHMGVSIVAPGAAIAAVPNWTLKRNQQMNGTSMASPDACGSIALILSGLKQLNVPYTAHRVRRAVVNTATLVSNVEIPAQGQGLLQVGAAFRHVQAHRSNRTFGLKFDVNIDRRGNTGIYLREPNETKGLRKFKAFVKAVLPESESKVTHLLSAVSGWRARLASTAPSWLSCPSNFHAANHRGFEIEVDTDKLTSGTGPHCAEILGFDMDCDDKTTPPPGPLFRIPVTIVKPTTTTTNTIALGSLQLSSGRIHRRFVAVPRGATWMDIHMRAGKEWGEKGHEEKGTNKRMVVVVAQQLRKETAHRDSMIQKYMWWNRSSEHVVSLAVEGGRTVEVVLAQFWSSLGDSSATLDLHFHGANVPRTVALTSTTDVRRVDVTASLRDVSLSPSGSLTELRTTYDAQKGADVQMPPSDRLNTLPDTSDCTKSLLLSYPFVLGGPDGSKATVTFHLSNGLSDLLYESAFDSQMIMVFDEHKKRIGVSDAFPTSNYKITVKVGVKHVARVHLRHRDASMLSKLKNTMRLTIRRKLSKAITVPVHRTLRDVTIGKTLKGDVSLCVGSTVPVFVSAPSAESIQKSLPKGFDKYACAGMSIAGTMTFVKRKGTLVGSRESPRTCTLEIGLGRAGGGESSAPETKKSVGGKDRSLDEHVRDARLAYLKSLSAKIAKSSAQTSTKKTEGEDAKTETKEEDMTETFESCLKALLENDPSFIPLLDFQLSHRKTMWMTAKDDTDRSMSVLRAVETAIDAIDATEVAAYFGTTNSPSNPTEEEKKKKKEMTTRRDVLRRALLTKCEVLLATTGETTSSSTSSSTTDEKSDAESVSDESQKRFDDALKVLESWIELKHPKYVLLLANRERAKKRRATEMKHINALLKMWDADTKGMSLKCAGEDTLARSALRKRRLDCIESISPSWSHWIQLERARTVRDFPKAYPFGFSS